MKIARLFVFLVATVGFCALVGSAVGAAFGHRVLFVGGFAGGVLGSCAAAWLGSRLRWIPAPATKATALGTVIGFLVAASIAVNTLHSPVGPVLSTLLIGIGGLAGLRFADHRSDLIK
jgi:hypothetical protein